MLNVVIPMAGNGSRFAPSAVPKPLIEIVPGLRMIECVIDALLPARPDRFLFVCRAEHVERYGLHAMFAARTPSYAIVETPGLTRGPASSALLAASEIGGDDELIVNYSDGHIGDMAAYRAFCGDCGADGVIVTMPSSNPALSYAAVDPGGRVWATAEKAVISRTATAGTYYFRRGRDFVRGARRMIAAEKTAAGEFFVAPVYNELIADGRRVVAYSTACANVTELGTPGDVARFRSARRGATPVAVPA